MADLKMSIENCAKSLAEARKKYDEVDGRKSVIEKEMTAATNNLNNAQKTFDAAVSELKDNAPWNTNWHSERTKAHRSAA